MLNALRRFPEPLSRLRHDSPPEDLLTLNLDTHGAGGTLDDAHGRLEAGRVHVRHLDLGDLFHLGRRDRAHLFAVGLTRPFLDTRSLLQQLLKEDPDDAAEGEDFISNLNPDSLEVIENAKVEPSLEGAAPGTRVQFERQGYFAVDPDSSADKLVFNRTVSLKDTWARIVARSSAKAVR